MSFLVPPTLDEINQYQWQEAAESSDLQICALISGALSREGRKFKEAGDSLGERVFSFLSAIAFLYLEPGNRDSPFRAGLISPRGSSPSLADFPEEAITRMAEIAEGTRSHAFRARLADIVWTRMRDHRFCRLAATAYLEAFRALSGSDDWAADVESLVRGIGLARMLGKTNETFSSFCNFLESEVERTGVNCEDSYLANIISIMHRYKVGELRSLARVTEENGSWLNNQGNGYLGRQYLDQARQILLSMGDNEEASRIGILKCDSLVVEADECLATPIRGYMAGCRFLAEAVEILRQSGGDPERIKSLHKRLIEWQGKIGDEMHKMEYSTDVSEIVEGVRKSLNGKSLRDSVLFTAFAYPLVDLSALRERVTKNFQNSLASIFGASMIAPDGRVLAHKPPAIGGDETTRQEAFDAEMFRQACMFDWNYRAQSFVNVCRLDIQENLAPDEVGLAWLISNNPVIPPGREPLFTKGILAGFRGNLDEVALFLVPQIEEMIRHVLVHRGHLTSKLDGNYIQEQRLLGTLLSMPEALEVFGETLVFEMRGLLCEKFGFDLRNRLAHGFMRYEEFWGVDVLNVWWLVLRLLCTPIISNEPEEEDAS